MGVSREEVASAGRVVIKVGTRVLTQADGRLSLVRLFQVVETIAALRRQGREALLVSSGATGLGRDALGLAETPTDLPVRQACAAIGQSRLMGLYNEGFARLGVICAQVLLTASDFEIRNRYLNLRRTLNTLLDEGVVPVINQNDVVSAEELEESAPGRPVFDDNDRLGALVASKLGCDLLVLLTDVPGVFTADPNANPEARLISRVDGRSDLEADLAGTASGVGRGGMRTKVEAGFIASRSGCHAVIVSGLDPAALNRAVRGEEEGTWFPAQGGMSARRRWIAFATRARGELHLDAGAVEALVDGNASLLAAGVTDFEGTFEDGDVVKLKGPDGKVIGRGIIRIGSKRLRADLSDAGGTRDRNQAIIRRNHLVLEGAHT